MILIYEFTSLSVSFVYLYKFTIPYSVNSCLIFCDLLSLLIRKLIFIFVKRMREGVFAAFPSAHGKQVRFFSSAPRSQFSLGRLAQGQYRDNIKAGSIKFHF